MTLNPYLSNRKLRRQTKNQFEESLEHLNHEGDHFKVTKDWMRKANPMYKVEERRRKDLEDRKLRVRKKQKVNMENTIREEMKIKERKIYKKYIKY